MALFKILKGNKSNLPSTKITGYMYITEDTGDIYVDTSTSTRIHLTSNDYVVCASAATATTKSITITGLIVTSGAKINVSFTKGHTGTSGTTYKFSVSSAPINFRGINIQAGIPYQFIYTGDEWVCQGSTLDELGITASATELNYSVGLAGNIQDQINTLSNTLYAHEALLIQTAIIQCTATYSSGVLTLNQDLACLDVNDVWEMRFIAPSAHLAADTLKIKSLNSTGTSSSYSTYTLISVNGEVVDDDAWIAGAIVTIHINPTTKMAYYSAGGGGEYIPVFGE